MPETYDTNTPLGTAPPADIDNKIREAKAAIQEVENVDHFWPLTGTQVSDADRGKHRRVVFHEALVSDPTVAADELALYSKAVGGISELFLKDELGNVKQLTTNGKLNISSTEISELAVLLTGNQTIAGVKTFGSIPVLPASSPTSDNQAARKRYVDDQMALVASHGFFYSGTTVFAATLNSTVNFQDLNIAAIVGANRTLCFFEVTTNGQATVILKPKGFGSTLVANHMNLGYQTSDGAGAGCADFMTAGKYMYLVSMTNTSGILEIGCYHSGVIVTIKLLGYLK